MTQATPPSIPPFRGGGLLSRFLTAPDRYPKLRYVYDIALIAISIICIISIILWTQGSGLTLFAIAPALAIGALGITLLISDLTESQKSKEAADAIAAVSLPFILTGTAAGLMFSAIAVGGGALILANPLFLMGSMTLGFALISLHKVTYQYLSNLKQVQQQNKLKQIELAAREHLGPEEISRRGSLTDSFHVSSSEKKATHHRHRTVARKETKASQEELFEDLKKARNIEEGEFFQEEYIDLPRNKQTSKSSDSQVASTLFSQTSTALESSDDLNLSYYTALSDSTSSSQNLAVGDVSGMHPSPIRDPYPKTERRVVRLSRGERNARHQRNKDQEQKERDSSSDDEDAPFSPPQRPRKRKVRRVK
ncbi:IncV family inclusion membrane protein [Chlamydia sp.]|uniref:IncV family inclusion membrane protein n=1 Tax=Chlamydia sp. TaxID=35827 RepID=UPI0025C4480A|nr:IncV family inclusion membrane protein [Chlamydia sp.]MBQ8498471.1 IncV family inclusion membrane protein [Chlamydia sp.]